MQTILNSTRRSEITIRRSGVIDLSARVVRLLGIAAGDVIDIGIHSGEFMLYLRLRSAVGSHQARCFPSNKRRNPRGHMRCYSRTLAVRMLDLVIPRSETEASFPCGEPVTVDGHICVPILTRVNLSKKNIRQ